MGDESRNKNKEYVNRYRSKQKALGRRARILYLTDHEFDEVRDTISRIRIEEELNIPIEDLDI